MTALNQQNLEKHYNKLAVLVVAAGRGSRMQTAHENGPKQYFDLGGMPVLQQTISKLLAFDKTDYLQVVIHADDRQAYDSIANKINDPRLLPPVTGGTERQNSVYNGLLAIAPFNPDFVFIHDGVRPFIDPQTLSNTHAALLAGAQAALPAIAVSDSLKRRAHKSDVLETVDRTNLYQAQTPQGFCFQTIWQAHQQAALKEINSFTDDTALIEWLGHKVELVTGNSANVKLTSPDDLALARQKVTMEQFAALADIRVGTGYDVHAFEAGDHAMLCGIKVPHNKKLKGHSDADVAMHALTDAIFAALADGDIGSHFPPSDPQWKGAASDQFLAYAIDKVKQRQGIVAHLDVTIICEAPKVGPHREAMRTSLAKICNVPISRVAVKATTSEKLGFTGREEGIAAMASATIRLPLDLDETC
ncbi:bifunctional 2-C-methyl-D-erythritol 4-phosphate cytidylyltransferase/2-C-methyl-D-erythritol 2,4-cyclodiphosphate synthase [Polycladidibacter stylochi]|uniref:bifunctional 2-C-methyl-D-erythritol 4-phosphate cytidylyltransferase/2-C-methyl-D-erythritol 2,4-cyclodiphosphate synthase n=1 Tax=Polycladidibacter stylochi TaxID=1807766 RepID=UPI0009EA7905|nr:bifunctional 2-C-methyl-D-erythritol 4-phosphate cytidylyltransferase/2-C-methyl-D-erythritol 2,4-cyclodiphosphate synthase [Pseudovibrio stylochi]